MQRSSSRRGQQPAAAPQGGSADEATSAPAGVLGGQATATLDGMRALLLQQVPAAVADLRRQHVAAAEPEERHQLARRLLMELLLRFCICAYG